MNRRDLIEVMAAAVSVGSGALSVTTRAAAATGPQPRPPSKPAAWPTRAVRVVVPYAVGSSPDMVARLVFEPVAKALGQPVSIDNRPGMGGNTGTADVARSTGDGYTFLYTIQGPLITAPLLHKALAYDPIEDFAPVTLVATSPNILVCDPALGVSDLHSFVRVARQRKAAMSYGSIGVGSAAHLAMELFKTLAGLETTHIPFQGLSEVIDAMQAGRVQAAVMVPAAAVGPVRAGRLTSLGITALGRVASLPDMPTFAEQGFPGFEAIAWHAVVAPADTPPAVIARMSSELVRSIKSEAIRSRLTAQYFSAAGTAPEALAGLMQTDRERWARLIKTAHVRVE